MTCKTDFKFGGRKAFHQIARFNPPPPPPPSHYTVLRHRPQNYDFRYYCDTGNHCYVIYIYYCRKRQVSFMELFLYPAHFLQTNIHFSSSTLSTPTTKNNTWYV